MARNQCVHADIRPDQAGVNVDGFSRNQARRLALSHDMYEDLAENICAPTLPDARQRGVIRQGLVQGVTDEPADREIDLRFTLQPPVLNDPKRGKPASISRMATSGSIPGRPLSAQ